MTSAGSRHTRSRVRSKRRLLRHTAQQLKPGCQTPNMAGPAQSLNSWSGKLNRRKLSVMSVVEVTNEGSQRLRAARAFLRGASGVEGRGFGVFGAPLPLTYFLKASLMLP
ncbi:predicted protein [Pyrenophora tritici-repentis Pt-1C-BFP]|uniref:Uncharacterized protein n=1 Tax=Pyrenophora tritici-repentis (strain Pt-1C-BFP) TaxID=426418 RepID=B2WMC7_PYRTR|nr:uncharacterized protein PTRG_11137 [Pyrenophora tritici-repentis Pt-1C-BFP]EDU44187.1 predicted protein [Pyrenophora tritici-repentis Pt-1C-BFP]